MDTPLAHEALDSLVTQFSSALDCLRELVQNSMDAGSPQVDVWLDYEAAEDGGAEGVITLHVDDYGVGMDEAVIDNELTRLFASSKEDDLTKIGKFGIGFVSIFALGPKAVILHTGRGGEYWEVFFQEDRSFTKTRVDTPVEGTQVTLFLTGDETRYLDLVKEARSTLKHWCRHSDVEIAFEDRAGLSEGPAAEGPEDINEAFTIEGSVQAAVEKEGTQMVLAYDAAPSYGFYNKGLTLAVSRDPDEVPERFAHISFKIKSRYLEHTLSRETVLKDEHYDKAMALLTEAADGALQQHLVQRLTALVAQPDWGVAEEQRYHEWCGFVLGEPAAAVRRLADAPLLRTVDGGAVSLADAATAATRDGRIFVSDTPSPLTAGLRDQGIPVILSRFRREAPDAQAVARGERRAPHLAPPLRLVVSFVSDHLRDRLWNRFLHVLTRTDYGAGVAALVSRPEDVYLAVELDEQTPEPAASLLDAAAGLLHTVGADYRALRGCVLGAASAEPPLFVIGRKTGGLMAVPPPMLAPQDRPRRPEAAVNRDHPQFRSLLRLHARAPALAAYCLAKDLLLTEDRLLEQDLRLLEAALPEGVAFAPGQRP